MGFLSAVKAKLGLGAAGAEAVLIQFECNACGESFERSSGGTFVSCPACGSRDVSELDDPGE